MDAWATVEEIAAGRSAIEESIVGWQAPVAYGVASIGGGGKVWAHVNAAGGTHQLPALVFKLLGVPPEECVPDERMNEIAAKFLAWWRDDTDRSTGAP